MAVIVFFVVLITVLSLSFSSSKSTLPPLFQECIQTQGWLLRQNKSSSSLSLPSSSLWLFLSSSTPRSSPYVNLVFVLIFDVILVVFVCHCLCHCKNHPPSPSLPGMHPFTRLVVVSKKQGHRPCPYCHRCCPLSYLYHRCHCCHRRPCHMQIGIGMDGRTGLIVKKCNHLKNVMIQKM